MPKLIGSPKLSKARCRLESFRVEPPAGAGLGRPSRPANLDADWLSVARAVGLDSRKRSTQLTADTPTHQHIPITNACTRAYRNLSYRLCASARSRAVARAPRAFRSSNCRTSERPTSRRRASATADRAARVPTNTRKHKQRHAHTRRNRGPPLVAA